MPKESHEKFRTQSPKFLAPNQSFANEVQGSRNRSVVRGILMPPAMTIAERDAYAPDKHISGDAPEPRLLPFAPAGTPRIGPVSVSHFTLH